MAKRRRSDPNFQIDSPASGSSLGTCFNVSGVCSELAGNQPPTITAVLMEDDDTVIASVPAETNPPADTWEASFTGVTEGGNRKIKAVTDAGLETVAVTGLTIADPVQEIQIEVVEPAPGQVFDTLEDGGRRRVKPATKGSHGNNRQVRAFVTSVGKRVLNQDVVVVPNSGSGAHPHSFKRDLRDLFPRNPAIVPDGKYWLHFIVKRGNRDYRVTHGHFWVDAARDWPDFMDPAFEINSPASGSILGTSFSVLGTCTELAGDPIPTIEVTLRIQTENGEETRRAQATPNLDESNNGTWEAFIPDAPLGWDGELSVTSTAGGATTVPVNGLTVVDPISTIQVEVEEPADGEVFDTLDPDRFDDEEDVPASNGRHGRRRSVFAFVSKDGVVDPIGEVEVDTTQIVFGRPPWSLVLGELFDELPTEGKFGLHFRVEEIGGEGREFYFSQGFFFIDPPENNRPLKK